jgi:hypothetical protein
MRTEAMVDTVELASRLITIPALVTIAAGVGALLGLIVASVLGRVIGNRQLETPGAIAGAVLLGLFALWSFIRPRKRQED